MKEHLWTIVRFPNGTWSGGGRPDDPAYALCEVFRVSADSYESAKKKAQRQRQKNWRRAEKVQ